MMVCTTLIHLWSVPICSVSCFSRRDAAWFSIWGHPLHFQGLGSLRAETGTTLWQNKFGAARALRPQHDDKFWLLTLSWSLVRVTCLWQTVSHFHMPVVEESLVCPIFPKSVRCSLSSSFAEVERAAGFPKWFRRIVEKKSRHAHFAGIRGLHASRQHLSMVAKGGWTVEQVRVWHERGLLVQFESFCSSHARTWH